ncbi:TRAP transporter permease [Brevibacterium sp. R8603A2]|uniref:TRAP transporter permease n=1 Tax=Brevibacterium sp. R8603A2 TaxID=2929779 RepID=UPI001FF8CB47|nr:TRAP transporter permease [Brevibacterium sp. R8603A2]MCK1803320.1 TRAP transporter permease [Brevibacterium sp. R8603A2]
MNQRITPMWKGVIVVLTVLGVLLAMSQAFFWSPFGLTFLTNSYLYYTLAFFLPIVFLIFPIAKSQKDRAMPFYDVVLAALTFVVAFYFGLNGENIVNFGWDKSLTYPTITIVFSFIFWLLVLEALRRAAGLVVTLIALVFSIYPMFALAVPVPFLQGIPYQLDDAARIHVMGVDSILGLPLQTAASILIGFLLFGVALQHTGGATFFYDLAQSVFGRYRGGSAKVSSISSAFMGMMSGSAVSNVLTTGPMTIPAMKKSGFPGRYAAGVEATASTGGTITPPIMGTAAFLMVSFVGVPYGEIALAAAIPAVLYYFGIYIQVDAYSAKTGLKGVPKHLLPRAGRTALLGWPYIVALIGLILLLTVQKNESQAPYWVVGFLLVVAIFMKDHRLTPKSFVDFLFAGGKTIAEIIGIIAGVGLIVGGLSMTGVSLSLARELITLVGDNLFLILIAGAVTSFVLGMGMTVSAVYVFLAIVMAPALTGMGINPIAAHLFVIYWATVSYITPPVALASFAAANIAGTPPMSTSLTAMRLGSVKYIIPFAFVLNPALVAQDSTVFQIIYTFVFALIGVFFLGCAFEGWMIGVARRLTVVMRVVLFAAGLATLAPELTSSLIGLAVGVVAMVVTRFWNDGGPEESAAIEREKARRLEAKDAAASKEYAAAHTGGEATEGVMGPTATRGLATDLDSGGATVLADDDRADIHAGASDRQGHVHGGDAPDAPGRRPGAAGAEARRDPEDPAGPGSTAR